MDICSLIGNEFMSNNLEKNKKYLEDWDYEKNTELSPLNYSMSSRVAVWWICEKKHSYKVSGNTRVRTNGCKICSREKQKKIQYDERLKTTKSFAENSPELLSEWDYEKNLGTRPEQVTWGSKKKIWWKCDQGHQWQTTPYARYKGSGCPVCARRTGSEKTRLSRLKKSGTLSDKFPALLKEWDYDNNTISPNEISPHSNKKVSWICKLQHRWKATVSNRTNRGSGCPECNPQTSKIEIYILCEIKSLFPNTLWRTKFYGVECDIYIPEVKLGIEIDGGYWHSEKLEKDKAKDAFLQENGVNLVRVREKTLPKIDTKQIRYTNGEDLQRITNRLVRLLRDIDRKFLDYSFEQNSPEEFKNMIERLPSPPEGETLKDIYPEVSKEWDYEKNYPLRPEFFTGGADQKFYWLCSEGHSYYAVVKNRTKNQTGCPQCYVKNQSLIALRGKLKTVPSLTDESPSYLYMFDRLANGLGCEDIPITSTLKLWWRCKQGHKFERTAVGMRTNSDCPLCNSLLLLHPELAKQLHPTKNQDLDASLIGSGYSSKVWWLCSEGHEWERDVGSRVREESDCPYCYNEKRSGILQKSAARRVGSLASKYPELLNLWDYEKNKLLPTEISSKSGVRVWWKCLEGHPPYLQLIISKTNGSGCPKCSNEARAEKVRLSRLMSQGSFEKNYPDLIKYWDYERNSQLDPSQLTSGSKERVSWICDKGHFWRSSLNTMTDSRRKHICPNCKNKKSARQ